jgi:hypothetical protein
MITNTDKSIWSKPTLISLDSSLTFADDCTAKGVSGSDARCTTATS